MFPRHGRRAALGHGALAMVVFHELRWNFCQEAAGHIRRDAAVHGPRSGIGHVELPFRPGNADVGQAPFFFDLRRVQQGPAVWEQAFVEAGQEDDREFQALGGVESHEGHFGITAFKIIDIADQGDVFQKVLEVAVGIAVHVIFGDRQEFADIFLAAFALRVVFRFFIEHITVASLFDDRFDEAQDIFAFDVVEEVENHGGEVFQRCPGSFGDGNLVRRRQGFKQGYALFFRIGCDVFHRRGADVPFRHVDDTRQAQAVFRVVEQSQIGQDVFDFLAVVELGAADHGIGNGIAHEFFFEDTGLGVGPEEDGHIAIRFMADFVAVIDDAGNVVGFIVFRLGLVMDDLVPCRVFRPQCLLGPAFVIVDDGIGGVEDGLCRSVVLFQFNRCRIGIVPGKVDDIADIGTAPGVNALVRIADDADVAPAGSQDLGQGVLGMVRILVFVDQDVLETGLVLFPNIFLFLQKAHGQEQEVVEVDSIVFPQLFLVQGVDVGYFLFVEIGGFRRKGLGVHEDVLSRRNGPQDGPRHELLVIEVELFQAVLDQDQLV